MLLVIGVIFSFVTVMPVQAAEGDGPQITASGDAISHEVDLTKYVVLDLAEGDITISQSGYSGYEWTSEGGNTVTNGQLGARTAYYIIQSNGSHTASVNGDILTTPAYQDITNVVNETDVAAVAEAWDAAAEIAGRAGTEHYITVTPSSDMDVTVVLDDIWSTQQQNSASSKVGGFVFNPAGTYTNAKTTVKLRGDNRMLKFYYGSSKDKNNEIIFQNFDNADSEMGSLTVVGNQNIFYANSSYLTKDGGNVTRNNWASVMGADDGTGNADGFVFQGGCIYVGAGRYENCSAIGGGGNDYGGITITGGIVTAVAHTTGAAIGGGIGHNSKGGEATITIRGGEVYAYNFGVEAWNWVSDYGSVTADEKTAASHIPGAAIGGGSSIKAAGAAATINIFGGTVYAESRGGCAIGGGSSIINVGGKGTVNIDGGNVTARSTGTVYNTNQGLFEVSASTAIGGGFSAKQSGGSTEVTISDGTIVSDGIGGGFSNANGYSNGTVTITGGSLNSEMAAIPTNGEDNVYLTRMIFVKDTETQSNKKVQAITFAGYAAQRQAVTGYELDDVYTDQSGMVYLWLPEQVGVSSGRLVDDTSVYEPIYEDDNIIDSKDIGALMTDGSPRQYVINIATTEYYTLYRNCQDGMLNEDFSGAIYVPQGEFSCYLQLKPIEGCEITLTPYIESGTAGGDKIFQNATFMTPVDGSEGLYRIDYSISRDLRVLFTIELDYEDENIEDKTYFTLDLTNDDVSVKQVGDQLSITQGEYTLSGYSGDIYLTSSGYPTDHRVTVSAEDKNTDSIGIFINHISASGFLPIFDIQSGSVDLSFGSADNIIQTTSGSAIHISEDAKLTISMAGKDSVKIDAPNGTSAITGQGSLTITDDGGFLKINTQNAGNTAPSISVGEYFYIGDAPTYTATLYDGTYSYRLIGYVDKNGELHAVGDFDPDNKDDFSSRGIVEAYTKVGVTAAGYSIKNGDLVFTLAAEENNAVIGEVSFRPVQENATTETLSFSEAASVQVTIDGEKFKDGHLIVMAAAKGLIPYTSEGYDGFYDEESHGIQVIFDESRFEITYTVDGESTTELPMYMGVINKEISFTIKAKSGIDGYTDAVGTETVRIRQAQNYWITEPKCNDIVVNSTPQPQGKARFGDAVWNGADAEYAVAGRHSISVTVAATENYTGLEQTVWFYVLEITVYANQGRKLDPLDANSTNQGLNISPTSAFTLYYTTQIPENTGSAWALTFNIALPEKSKITMIEFQNDRAQYYYCHLNEATTVIDLTDFVLMGTDDCYESNQVASTYQFCFDFSETGGIPKQNNQLSVSLKNGDIAIGYSLNIVLAQDSLDLQCDELMTDNAFYIEVPVHVIAGGPYNKVLAVKIDSDAPQNLDVKLFSEANKEISPTDANGNIFCFELGQVTTMEINARYTLRIQATDEVCIQDIAVCLSLIEGTVNYPYVWMTKMQNGVMFLSLIENEIEISAPSDDLRVQGPRVVTADTETIEFEMDLTEGKTVSITLQIRNDAGGYQPIYSLSPTVGEDGTLSFDLRDLGVYLSQMNEPIVVRLVFACDGAVCNYNLIVKNEKQ